MQIPADGDGRQDLPLIPGPTQRGIDLPRNPEIPRRGIERWDVTLVQNRPASGDHLSRRNAVCQAGGNDRAASPPNWLCFQRHWDLER
jgi:hypothetical protein